MEKKIIEAKFSKNKNANIILTIGIIILSLFSIILISDYSTGVYYEWIYSTAIDHKISERFSIFEYLFEVIFFPFSDYNNGLSYFYLFWIAVIVFVAYIIIILMMNHCALTVTNTRVIGKASFGKQVDLPITQISAIGLGAFGKIAVATSAGRVNFWLIENRSAIHKALNDLLMELKSETKTNIITNMPASNADELKKFKELLDNGIITQEEFDQKKKQLLGL